MSGITHEITGKKGGLHGEFSLDGGLGGESDIPQLTPVRPVLPTLLLRSRTAQAV